MLYKVYYTIGEKRMWMEVEANSRTHAEQILMQKVIIVKVVPSDSDFKSEPEIKRKPRPPRQGGDIWDFLRQTGLFP